MQFERGPLSKLLNHAKVVAAAKGYVTARVRVPEAYLLLQHYATTRPGLLVLDADGRRVHSIPLPGMGAPRIAPDAIARQLEAAKKAPATEIWTFEATGDDASLEKLRAALARDERVDAASRTKRAFRLGVAPGALAPAKLTALAKTAGVEIAIREPVAVRLAGNVERSIAGMWHKEDGRAYVTGLLLQPAALGPCDLEARQFDLPGIPKGGAACRVAMAPLTVRGVLSIHVDIFNERQTVVGRKGAIEWPKVVEAFKKAGCEARQRR